ncbi:MAG: CoA-acylating methylmalonate-semialdehyde dehydrogenase [Candidatus Thermoplasmatota archaeon]
MYGKLKNYINGNWVDSKTKNFLPVRNPATAKVIGEVPLSTKDEVYMAVRAAKEAFNDWRETSPLSRARYFFDLKNIFEENFEELARVIVEENGKTIDEARGSVRRTIENIETAAGIPSLMMGYSLEDGAGSNIDEEVIIQPLGVFACIVPFNFPAMVPFWFMPYAVATGNTFIVKPSEKCPISQTKIFELINEVDFPPGVINLIHGAKDVVDNLLDHQEIKGISFVGSTPVAKYIYERGTKNGKRVQCQGGAKNCLVVMPDANLESTVPNLINSFFGCAGERCLAGSILIAVGDVYNELKERFTDAASKLKVGYGMDEGVQMGPVISKESKERIIGYIENGIKEGAKLILDGRNIKVKGYEDGYFIGPTIFDNVKPEMKIARDEIFGPFACIMHVENLNDALKIIHSLPFGNATSIYTQNGKSAREFKYKVQCGNIGINIGIAAPMAYFPFSGYKESFFGDLHGQGRDAINFFTERKVVITRWF